MSTGYFTHKDCRQHEMGPGHPECPERLDAIDDRLLISGVSSLLDHRDAPLVPLADVELAHDRMYVAALRGMSDRLVEELDAGGPRYAQFDPDTSINPHTWQAIQRSAGAALAATVAGLARCERTPGPCRFSKLRLVEVITRVPSGPKDSPLE